MLALYRAGRQADALEAYRRARHALVEDLGLDPSPALQRLEAQILDHDPALERGCSRSPGRAGSARRTSRSSSRTDSAMRGSSRWRARTRPSGSVPNSSRCWVWTH
jgi:DNA-binding SARP family transcriptional activator